MPRQGPSTIPREELSSPTADAERLCPRKQHHDFNDALSVGHWDVALALAFELAVGAICFHVGALIQEAAKVLGCIVLGLPGHGRDHVVDGGARRHVAGLPDAHDFLHPRTK